MTYDAHFALRVSTVVATTCIALSCGINYAYSAWGPEFAERMHLTATQGEMIGTAGNLGMYAIGIPGGALIDKQGPRVAGTIGAFCIASGYSILWYAYQSGPGSLSQPILWFASFLTGGGSFLSFNGGVKVCLTNWPDHRGTATAIPVAAFGLSAFAYSLISHAFSDSIDNFLLLVSIAPLISILIGTQFLRYAPPDTTEYQPVASDDDFDRPPTRRKKSNPQIPAVNAIQADVTGLTLYSTLDFWKLFILAFCLGGVGLMTINNIGNDARALWYHRDPNVTHDFVQARQLMHVGLLSLASCAGRLFSGIGSDVVVRRLQGSRVWMLVASAGVFLLGQLSALTIQNPNLLVILTLLTGLAYGCLFGVLPAVVGETFGMSGMGQNWGSLLLAPTLSGFFYNTVFGATLDAHTKPSADGSEGRCVEGRACYSAAYIFTALSSMFGLVWALLYIYHETRRKGAKTPSI